MNSEQMTLVRTVLGLSIGEIHFVREAHLFPGMVYRATDGWMYLLDVSDRHPCPRSQLGWFFTYPQDMADFLLGDPDQPLTKHKIFGEAMDI